MVVFVYLKICMSFILRHDCFFPVAVICSMENKMVASLERMPSSVTAVNS